MRLCRRLSGYSLFALLISVARTASGQTVEAPYCAFEIRVTTPEGIPASGVTVLLLEAPNTVLKEGQTDSTGRVRFCDAPLKMVSVVAGVDWCGSVYVKGVRPTWPRTQTVMVTYRKQFCENLAEDSLVLIRVADQQGKPVVGAVVEGAGGEISPSDEFGRIFVVIRRGDKREVSVRKEGFVSGRLSLAPPEDEELRLTLKRP